MSEENRQVDRSPVTLKVEYSDKNDFLQDYTENISKGGTMVRSAREFAIGDRLELMVSFPGLLKHIPLAGIVRWSRQEGGENCFGVEFDRLSDEERDALDRLVHRILSGDDHVVSKQTLRVLMADDNVHIAKLVRRGLEAYIRRTQQSTAFALDHATNGVEALERLGQKDYDLLVIDLAMPVMDGRELIQAVRGDDQLRRVPIIAISRGPEENESAALAAGADFFIRKPLRLADLLHTIQRLG